MQLRKALLFFFSLLAISAFVISACGGDDDDAEPTEAEGTEEPEATEDVDATEPEGTEVEGTEEPTEEEVTEVVEHSDNPTQGITDDEIVIGAHFPLSGPVAVYAPIADAIRAYFESIGPVNGRTIRYETRDDGYNPAQTVEVTNQLVEQEGVAAFLAGLGTPTHSQVVDTLAEQGIPDLLIASGCSCWTDPLRPTTFAANGNYVAEGRSLGQYIVDQGFATIAAIYQNDEFGQGGFEGMVEVVGDSAEVISEETYEANARDLTSQTINAIADNPDVLYIFATPVETGSAINAARSNGYEGQIVISTVAATDFLGALTGTPENLTGTVTLAGLKLLSQSDDAGIQAHIELMEGAGIQASNFTVYGQAVAEIFVEALTNAGADVTRGSLVAAMESITGFQCSVCLGEINFGPDDHRALETFIFVTFDGTAFVPVEGAEPIADEGN
ncbi:MAG: ABC transporter substrate-binding protein [Dehalococcoidia bacterium]